MPVGLRCTALRLSVIARAAARRCSLVVLRICVGGAVFREATLACFGDDCPHAMVSPIHNMAITMSARISLKCTVSIWVSFSQPHTFFLFSGSSNFLRGRFGLAV